MSRKLRFVPPGGALVEVTCRTQQRRLLLRPSRELNETVVGVLGRAMDLYPVELVAAVFLSNHYHLLLWVENSLALSRFMCHLGGNLSREVGRLHDWPQTLWGRRYDAIVISDEEEAQVARLRYVLAHGAKEGLVPSPEDWPGVHCATSLLSGEPLKGFWFDRSREYAARRLGRKLDRYSFADEMNVEFQKLPCWRHLSDQEYQNRIASLVDRIVDEVAGDARRTGGALPSASTCRRRICRQHPHSLPGGKTERRDAPAFHVYSRQARQKLRVAYAAFVTAFRVAAELLRNGDRSVRFPPGSFPPGLPYVETLNPARAP